MIELNPIDKLAPIYTADNTHICLYGGRGGTKSWAVADLMLLKALTCPGKLFLSTREIQKSIEKSNYATLKKRIADLNLKPYFNILRDRIDCVNSSEIIFEGLRSNVDSILSMHDIRAVHFEEAAFISRNSMDLVIPTATRFDDIQFYWTFNPRYTDDPVYQSFLASDKERIPGWPYDWRQTALIIKVNWTDNPYLMEKKPDGSWKKKAWHEEVSNAYRNDPEFAEHIYGGDLLRRSDSLVYKEGLHWEIDEDLSVLKSIPQFAQKHVALDLGFNHPTALIEAYSWSRDGSRYLYIVNEIYRKGVPGDDVPDLCLESEWVRMGYPMSVDPASKQVVEIIAKPKYNINIRRARKGANSIQEGITIARGYKTFVHPKCTNVINEYEHYSYKIDKDTQEVLLREPPIDDFNHALDAKRYLLEELHEEPTQSGYIEASVVSI